MSNVESNADLHGSAPDRSSVALLIVDMLTDFELALQQVSLKTLSAAAQRISVLKKRATQNGIPCIYVNDNAGRWQSAGHRVIEQNTAAGSRFSSIAEQLIPDHRDYLVLKPKHSAFYATPLDVLLSHLGVSALVITGMVGKQCILFTAMDAFVREYQLYLPMDCIVTSAKAEASALSKLFATTLDADIRPSGRLRLYAMCQRHECRSLRN
jgi:nicotinamidase-related amidase